MTRSLRLLLACSLALMAGCKQETATLEFDTGVDLPADLWAYKNLIGEKLRDAGISEVTYEVEPQQPSILRITLQGLFLSDEVRQSFRAVFDNWEIADRRKDFIINIEVQPKATQSCDALPPPPSLAYKLVLDTSPRLQFNTLCYGTGCGYYPDKRAASCTFLVTSPTPTFYRHISELQRGGGHFMAKLYDADRQAATSERARLTFAHPGLAALVEQEQVKVSSEPRMGNAGHFQVGLTLPTPVDLVVWSHNTAELSEAKAACRARLEELGPPFSHYLGRNLERIVKASVLPSKG